MTSTGRSSRAVGRPRANRPPSPRDPLAAAVEVWASVVSGLESARYAEVGTEYAKLSALLVQQRTTRPLADAPAGADWDELSRLAQRALDLLEPLLGAARLLAALPATVPAAIATPSPAARRGSRGPAEKPRPGSATEASDEQRPRKAPRRTATHGSAPTQARHTESPPTPRAATRRS